MAAVSQTSLCRPWYISADPWWVSLNICHALSRIHDRRDYRDFRRVPWFLATAVISCHGHEYWVLFAISVFKRSLLSKFAVLFHFGCVPVKRRVIQDWRHILWFYCATLLIWYITEPNSILLIYIYGKDDYLVNLEVVSKTTKCRDFTVIFRFFEKCTVILPIFYRDFLIALHMMQDGPDRQKDGTNAQQAVDWLSEVLRPTRHKTRHIRDDLHRRSLGLYIRISSRKDSLVASLIVT